MRGTGREAAEGKGAKVMRFIESRVSVQTIRRGARLALLDRLEEKGLTPLIRATRRACYEQALLGREQRIPLMERDLAAWTEDEEGTPYVRGDVFFNEDFVLFLIFGAESGLRAGIIHEAETTEPLKKLEAFCRNLSEAFEGLSRASKVEGKAEGGAGSEAGGDKGEAQAIEWQPRASKAFAQSAAARFSLASEAASASILQRARGESVVEDSRGLELLEDTGARRFLHRLREMHPGGRVSELLADEEDARESEALINRLSLAGLLRREMLVSCRKVGRPLFRLPSPEALNVITASNAMCSECGASIADEKVEDFIKPTETVASLLQDGSWLSRRTYSLLREQGLPDRHIAFDQPESEDDERHILAQVCNNSFLFVLRDGDLTLAQARRAFDKLSETAATHLFIVTTGDVQEEARVRLREQARRRARTGGGDPLLILVENLDTLAAEMRRAFERVSARAISEELCELDTSLGLSVGHIITTRFRLMRQHPTGALKDLTESAVSTLAGSLREI